MSQLDLFEKLNIGRKKVNLHFSLFTRGAMVSTKWRWSIELWKAWNPPSKKLLKIEIKRIYRGCKNIKALELPDNINKRRTGFVKSRDFCNLIYSLNTVSFQNIAKQFQLYLKSKLRSNILPPWKFLFVLWNFITL